MKILGISAYYHDSAAALVVDGMALAAAQEERFSRIKHDPAFPEQAIRFCLREANCSLDDLDAVVFYDKPFLKFERILQTVLETAPRGLPLFIRSMPVWLKEKLFLKDRIRKQLNAIHGKTTQTPLFFSGHHISHAASAFFASPYNESAILTIDGVGEWGTASIALGRNNEISMLKELHFPHSLGLLYAAFTSFLGFKVNEGEYKVMGLAPYADKNDSKTSAYYELIKNQLAELHDDGSIRLNLAYFSYTHATRMLPVKKWEKLFGIKKRETDAPLGKEHAALAYALQRFTEEAVQKMAHEAKRLTGAQTLCMAGGVALNCVSNGKLMEENLFEDIYVQPASGDAGGALGAALALYHMHFKQKRIPLPDFMQEGELGTETNEEEIQKSIAAYGLRSSQYPENELLENCARFLAEGKVIGWFSGRMEFGPRALGNRSILADAAHPEMQKTVNLKIKKRESFRPFAPIMLEEELQKWFDKAVPNPYMLFVYKFKEEHRISRPENFDQLTFSEMLNHAGSPLPAVTHIDYSARIHTLAPNSGKKIRRLLEAYKNLTGRGILINTSFNVKDEPIVCSPSDAIRCFLQTEMDILVLENHIIDKQKQA